MEHTNLWEIRVYATLSKSLGKQQLLASVCRNNKVLDWTVTLPSSMDEGGRFYLEGRNRALNATGRLASNWEFDTLSIWKGNPLHVVISKYSF